MTELTKPVTRRVRFKPSGYSARELIVRIAPEGLYLREAGRRTWYGPMSWNSLHVRAAELSVEPTRRQAAVARRRRLQVGL
jgi:hypothetical protein